MEFRTTVDFPEISRKIGTEDIIFSVGSCFAENIAGRLADSGFRVASNPLGVLYNPASIGMALRDIFAGREYTDADLALNGDLWCSPSFHGSFSGISKDEVLTKMNRTVHQAGAALARSTVVLISLGTPWVYTVSDRFTAEFPHIGTGSVVANCHKFPAGFYDRRRLTVEEIAGDFNALVNGPLKGKKVFLTVSPVRYIKDGLHGSNLGKAVLLLAAERICGGNTDVNYFPAYEAVLDDLRDYRFYAGDMVHPSRQAVEYIWELFRTHAMTVEADSQAQEVGKLTAATRHRIQNPGSGEHLRWLSAMIDQVEKIKKRFPDADVVAHKTYFRGELSKYGRS